MLVSLLDDHRIYEPRHLEAAFAAFDEIRRPRDLWLVQSSRKAADMYEWRAPDIGDRDDESIQREIDRRQAYIWDVDLNQMVQDARESLGRHLGNL